MELRDKIAQDLKIPLSFIDEALKFAHKRTRLIHVPKSNGGTRTIYLPYSKVKTIQYWLVHNVFSKLPIHKSAVAYQKGISTLDNATRHKNKKYFLKLDLKDFFPSIKSIDLMPIVRKWHKKNNIDWLFNKSSVDVIEKCCFNENRSLAIGYPSSPIISNVVMYDFDKIVSKAISDKSKFGSVIYTRYADDLLFSTNKPNVCKQLLVMVKGVINDIKSPSISANNDKTGLASSTGGSAFVTGLRICGEGHITVHRKYKDHIRLLLSLLNKGELDKSEYESLRGHLSYVKYVAPDFYTRLQNKYFAPIEKLYQV
jgi:RNA-directed DNA polymerase